MKKYKSTVSEFGLKYIKSDFPKAHITCSKDISEYVRQFYFDDIHIYESFFIVLLNRANNTIGYAKISQGGIVGTVGDVRIIAKYAVDSMCSSVILCHNHPSGTLQPSSADISITSKTKNALALFDIGVLDHIILSDTGYYSMADEGVL